MSRETSDGKVVTTEVSTSLENTARLMKEKHVDSIIVADHEHPVGMVTEREVELAEYVGFSPEEPVQTVMTDLDESMPTKASSN